MATRENGASPLTPERRAAIDRLWRRLGMTRVAVRSSAGGEDGHGRSFAGVFDSILGVGRDGLEEAVRRVQESYSSAEAESYSGHPETGGVIVQNMVDAEYAGVLFTRHPSTAGLALVEMVSGTGDALASGLATPKRYEFGRYSGRPVNRIEPPMDVRPLLALGRRAEALFGGPQDIEWAYRDGRFFILQSRDITEPHAAAERTDEEARIESERARLLALVKAAAPDEVALAQNELSELVPQPTPSTLSLLEAMWRPGGSVDLACRALGLNYEVEEEAPPYLVSAFGRLYVNKAEEHRRTGRIGRLAAFRLNRAAEAIEKGLAESFLPSFLREVRLLEATDFDRLSTDELFDVLETVRHRFITRTYVEAEIVNLAAAFYMEQAKAQLEGRNLSPANYLSDIPETAIARGLTRLQSVTARDARMALFLELFGHRAQLDYELSCPRYAEDADLADFIIDTLMNGGRARSAETRPLEVHGWQDRLLAAAVTRARRFQTLKEDAKHHCLRELAVLRRVLLALDRRLLGDGAIFYLGLDEVPRLAEPDFVREAVRLSGRRREEARFFVGVAGVPAELGVATLETLRFGEEQASVDHGDAALKGVFVSGAGPVVGRARVVSALEAQSGFGLAGLEEGEIVVSRFIHPKWVSHFPCAAALVCEIGGWLSHTAILAREYHLPMLVGVRGLESIRNGDILRLLPDGSVERIGGGGEAESLPFGQTSGERGEWRQAPKGEGGAPDEKPL